MKMKKRLQLQLLFISSFLFMLSNGVSKPISNSHLKIEKSFDQEDYPFYYVIAQSGLNYRESPKGKILGKFPFNFQLKVIERSKILDEIRDNAKVLKGEWFGVEHGLDTVYVFSGFLSFNKAISDIKIYNLWPYSVDNDGNASTAFINVSDSYFPNSQESPALFEESDYKDTIRLNAEQRILFLKTIHFSESDHIFIYDIKKDLVKTFKVQDFPLIACVNVYAAGASHEYDYEFGFDLGKKFKTDRKMVYIGKENPFQTGKLKSIQWKKIDPKEFPLKFDLQLIDIELVETMQNIIPNETYIFAQDNLLYYLQNLEKNGIEVIRYLVVLNSETKDLVSQKIYMETEGTYLTPLNTEIKTSPHFKGQWTGQLFKNQPAVIFGFMGHSFGCPYLDVLSSTKPAIPILCDNRH